MSARQEDLNGFIEIKGNPLSKVGVFQYLGKEISSNLIADKIYNVYRPEEELSSEECINSFRLVPFTDEHSFLGSSSDGLMPAEKKGVHGTTGEDIYFESPYLKGNLKLFSESIAKEIEDGKQEISIGYRSDYEQKNGSYNGISYNLIQRNIRGNHVALVGEGRSGHDVKVLDCYKFKFTLDSGVLKMEEEDLSSDENEIEKKSITLESLASKLEAIEKRISEIGKSEKKEILEDEEPENPYAKSEDEETEKKLLNEDEGEEEEEDEDEEIDNEAKEEKREAKDKKSKDKKSKDKKSMDSASFKKVLIHMSQRDSLVTLLKPHIGVFDHSAKTLQEVAEYGVKKLGITCKKGQEEAVLSGYLVGRKAYSSSIKSSNMDSKITDNALEEYISQGAIV